VAAYYTAISSVGTFVAGTAQLTGAITGDTKSGEAIAKAAETVTTVSGIVGLVKFAGNMEMASKSATIERTIGSLLQGPIEIAKHPNLPITIVKGLDGALGAKDAGPIIKEIISYPKTGEKK
jgi:hypothetical protein